MRARKHHHARRKQQYALLMTSRLRASVHHDDTPQRDTARERAQRAYARAAKSVLRRRGRISIHIAQCAECDIRCYARYSGDVHIRARTNMQHQRATRDPLPRILSRHIETRILRACARAFPRLHTRDFTIGNYGAASTTSRRFTINFICTYHHHYWRAGHRIRLSRISRPYMLYISDIFETQTLSTIYYRIVSRAVRSSMRSRALTTLSSFLCSAQYAPTPVYATNITIRRTHTDTRSRELREKEKVVLFSSEYAISLYLTQST